MCDLEDLRKSMKSDEPLFRRLMKELKRDYEPYEELQDALAAAEDCIRFEEYGYSYSASPNPDETFTPEYYLFTKLEGEGYNGTYVDFIESGGYAGAIEVIQGIIDDVRSLEYPLRIYRGVRHDGEYLSPSDFISHESGNMSWTHKLSVAKDFGYGGSIFTGIVDHADVDLQATINRNVLHSLLHEGEIVLKDNNSIKDLKQLK